MFKKVNPRQNFPEMEKNVLKFWRKNKIFKKSVEGRGGSRPAPTYSFFDGPPFATGLPHYGHVVANLMKDVVPRYWTMRGYKVERRWGWDCHGLPVENLIEKERKIKNKQEIEEWGVDNFNKACCDSVLRYADEWKKFIPRIGRWVDMENDYRTMDWKYTESIWWVFSELYKKGLVYEGYKSMHICPRCETTLSNFEVTQEYKYITDLSATVKFRLKAGQKIGNFKIDENTFVLAWTTTPWTLPGNVALAVGGSIKYQVVSIKGKNEEYILAKDIYDELYNKDDKNPMKLAFDLVYADNKKEGEKAVKGPKEIIEFKGKELVGLEYEPLFDYYSKKEDLKNKENGWKIYAGDFVTTEEGTGVVHIAPAFGDDDMKMAEKHNLPFVQHVGMNGRFRDEVVDFRERGDFLTHPIRFANYPSQEGNKSQEGNEKNKSNETGVGLGREVKPKRNPRETDEKIVKWLEENNKLFSKENYKHSYPHCWRCDTPLLNYATSSWFVKVTEIKDKMVKNNQKVNWTPEYIKDGRFGKWLEDARDWAVSRSRFWGAPLPIWRCGKCKKIEVINSIDDLRSKTPQKITKFILLRHGESESNVLKVKAGGSNKYGLTEKGIRQCETVAKDLKNQKIDFIVTSPIKRAKQTTKIINKELNLEVIENDLVKEYDFGKWNGYSEEDLLGKSELYDEYEKIKESGNNEERYNFAFGGDGESRQDVEKRVRKFINECARKYSGKNILVVAHGGINAMFNRIINEYSIEKTFIAEFSFGNAEQNVFYTTENGKRFDLHKPNIDKVEIKCSQCGGKAKIVGDVFDCWFESGSMPYAQCHYPFENKDKFAESFPADFIAEGIDQTRGWFYTLMVLSTALFDKPAFKNVIANGIVQAENGQKMSKRLKNYPEPNLLVEKYGADALRYYLLTSPVMKAENLNFSERSVEEVLKKFILTLWNVYSFLVMNAGDKIPPTPFAKEGEQNIPPLKKGVRRILKSSPNLLDKWILSEFNILVEKVNKQMQDYDLVKASRPLREFVDKLSNWFVRRSRKRFASENIKDRDLAFQTLHYVLIEYTKLLAPFMPFLAEEIYQNLTDNKESVHLEDYPVADKKMINKKVSDEMNFVRDVVALGLAIRAKNSFKVRQPLWKLEIGKLGNWEIE
ncbi:MAG: class I tRNA ligase family protein, partial [Patescibacteria group bacterium]|nr:class I tRNA ligase family protein [Patescibacteria group bacterium]